MHTLLGVLVALAWGGVLGAAREIDCYGSLVKIDIVGAPTTNLKSPPAVYGLPSLFGAALNATSVGPLPLYTAEPEDACSEVTSPAAAASIGGGAAAIVSRGNCSFTTKAVNLQTAGFSAMLLYNNDTSDSCIIMSGNDTEAGEVHLVGVSITATAADILKTLAASQGSVILTQPPSPGPYDPAEAVLWGLAVATVLGGGLWAGSAVQTGRDGGRRHTRAAQADQVDENAIITARAAASFIFVASGALVGLYLFLSEWLAVVLTLLFAFVAWQSTAVVLGSLFRAISPATTRNIVVQLPCTDGATPMPLVDLLGAIISAAITVSWLAMRHHVHWAWILQDIISICLMLFILRSIHLPNIQVACILLPAALLYDVWWVFIQPRVTGGESVMVAVAAGGFDLPMLLAVPQWYSLGTNPGLTILGLGDVVLPGLLVAFSRRWDVAVDAHGATSHIAASHAQQQQQVSRGFVRKGGYFLPLVAAYGAGLLITFIALAVGVGGGQGQPALLYLVPCTLGTMLALGWWRGEIGALWKGDVMYQGRGIDSGRDEEEAGASLLGNNGVDEIQEAIPPSTP